MTTFWRRPQRSPVCSTVRETCSCGAVFEMRAHPSRAGYEAQQFRARHAVCRSIRATASVASEEDGLLNSEEPKPKLHCGYCGYVGWTIQHYGRVTHKESCPARTDPWCQSHPKGCPVNSEEPSE